MSSENREEGADEFTKTQEVDTRWYFLLGTERVGLRRIHGIRVVPLSRGSQSLPVLRSTVAAAI